MEKKEKITVRAIEGFKKAGHKISALTAYDYPFAKLLDESGVDIILVGDSLGNVMLGYRNTIPVTMEEMIIHTKAAARGVKRALLVADLPFGSYEVEVKQAVANAIALAKAGAQAVKLEGADYAEAVKAIIKAGIPVMGHVGFIPQSVNSSGCCRQGGTPKEAARIIAEAARLEKVGCFAIVLELIPPELAKKISNKLKIPTIGIGAGPDCDGQILVTYDMLGLYPNPPKFVKKYADLSETIKSAVKKFKEAI
jgi:3-methyl-2-oxobutanoate hydroxymethyltransferase